ADSTLEEFENDFLDYFQTIFSLQTDKTFLFRYSLENQFIEIKYHKNGAHLSYSKAYSELFTEIRKIYSKPSTSGILGDLAQHIIAVPFLDRIRSGTNQFVGGQYLFIPSNRTHFSLLQQPGRPPLSIISDDPISSGFQRLYNSLRKQQSRRKRSSFPFYNTNKIVAGLIDKILRGTFTKEEKEDIIIHHNGTRSSLRQASSGQQEALPLLLVFEYLVSASSPQVPSTVYVEEPETHLHPKASNTHLIDVPESFPLVQMAYDLTWKNHGYDNPKIKLMCHVQKTDPSMNPYWMSLPVLPDHNPKPAWWKCSVSGRPCR
ncbi:MAG: ATP-binding protein, partial [Sphingobacteriales bacterium]